MPYILLIALLVPVISCTYDGPLYVLNIDSGDTVRIGTSPQRELEPVGALQSNGGDVVGAHETRTHLFVLRSSGDVYSYDYSMLLQPKRLGTGYCGLTTDQVGSLWGIRLTLESLQIVNLDNPQGTDSSNTRVIAVSPDAASALRRMTLSDIIVESNDKLDLFVVTRRLNKVSNERSMETTLLTVSNEKAELRCELPVAGGKLIDSSILLCTGRRSLEQWNISNCPPTLETTYTAQAVLEAKRRSGVILVLLRPAFSMNLMAAEAPIGVLDSDGRLWNTSMLVSYNSISLLISPETVRSILNRTAK